jgi:hypothetical protein
MPSAKKYPAQVPHGGTKRPLPLTSIREEDQNLVRGLRPQGHHVPEHVPIPEVRHGVPLQNVDKTWKQNRISYEEDRSVVPHQIPDPVFGVELQSEPPNVPHRIRIPHLPRHLGEPHRHRRLLPYFGKHLRRRVLSDVVGDLEVSERSRPFRVDHPLRDSLPAEVGEFVDQDPVLEQSGPSFANREGGVLVPHGIARIRGGRGFILVLQRYFFCNNNANTTRWITSSFLTCSRS